MRSLADTVVAPITGLNRAAVAVVRLSGDKAWKIASQVFSPWPDPVVPRTATYGRFDFGDDGLSLPFESGSSYTGEETVELSVHGSLASVRRLVEACCRLGARPAEPGEFTYRAFMNGRIDLTQAEGVRDTVEALTEGQLRQANLLREGGLRRELEAASRHVLAVLAAVEAATDFEEETGPLDRQSAVSSLDEAARLLERAAQGAVFGRIVREGVQVAITGRPNAGKSSLLNRIVGSDRAIVTAVPGTTRDTVEAVVEHQGLALRLVDTAGLRSTDDPVESLGVERSLEAIAGADVVWHVYDSGRGWTPEDQESADRLRDPWIQVANKADLDPARSAPGSQVCALTGEGIQTLLDQTVEVLAPDSGEPSLLNRRHAPLLESARTAISEARATIAGGLPHDLAAVHLQATLRCLGEVTGASVDDSVLESLFATFCIGK